MFAGVSGYCATPFSPYYKVEVGKTGKSFLF